MIDIQRLANEMYKQEEIVVQKILPQYCTNNGISLEAIQENARYVCTHNPFKRQWFFGDELILTVTYELEGNAVHLIFVPTFEVKDI